MSDQVSFNGSVTCILQLPLQLPVMKRELANKMYVPTTYLLGRFIANMITNIVYPMVMILMMYWGLGLRETNYNFWMMTAYGLISNLIYCG